MPKTRKKDNQESIGRGKVARAVFSATESLGISDRTLLEQFTEQISQRLGVGQLGVRSPLLAMEGLILERRQKEKCRLEPPEIKDILKKALTEMEHLGIAEACVREQKPLPVVV